MKSKIKVLIITLLLTVMLPVSAFSEGGKSLEGYWTWNLGIYCITYKFLKNGEYIQANAAYLTTDETAKNAEEAVQKDLLSYTRGTYMVSGNKITITQKEKYDGKTGTWVADPDDTEDFDEYNFISNDILQLTEYGYIVRQLIRSDNSLFRPIGQ